MKRSMTNQEIEGELQAVFSNKLGDNVVVYVNLLLEEMKDSRYNRLYLKIRTNRFIERSGNEWMRILDFKDKKNEFYLTIDSPFSRIEVDNVESVETEHWTVLRLKECFGVDIESVWKSVVDDHCSWELEKVAL